MSNETTNENEFLNKHTLIGVITAAELDDAGWIVTAGDDMHTIPEAGQKVDELVGRELYKENESGDLVLVTVAGENDEPAQLDNEGEAGADKAADTAGSNDTAADNETATDDPPQRTSPNQPFNSAERAEKLKSTSNKLKPTVARDAMPDDNERLKDMLEVANGRIERLTLANTTLETEQRKDAPKVRDYDRMKNVFENEVGNSQSKFLPAKGQFDESIGIQIHASPLGQVGIPGTAVFVVVRTKDNKVVNSFVKDKTVLTEDNGSYLIKV